MKQGNQRDAARGERRRGSEGVGLVGRAVGAFAVLFLAACASSSEWRPPASLDHGDVPAETRPGFGNTELHTWWPLTPAEVAALKELDKARRGDAHALLGLAVLAAGDRRDAASYADVQRQVDKFLAEVRPAVAGAPDTWHRGYELHRAMHRVFFRNNKNDMAGYQFEQARVTEIFVGGRYNCLSSAMLFAVLARGFDLPVHAAIVPTHVFIEMDAPGGKVFEIETTSATGFDWVHDERFYKEEAASWSGRRGLRPVTLDEYRRRNVVEPYRLMATGMRNAHAGESHDDRIRLDEIAALVDPDDVDAQRARLIRYANEAHDLYQAKAWRTLAALFDTVWPAVAEIGTRSKDAKTLELVSWAQWYRSSALMVAGRQAEAMALMDDGLQRLDVRWDDAAKLRNNYTAVLVDRIGELIAKKDFAGTLEVYTRHREVCRSSDVCANNVGVAYGNWSIEHENAGDWQSARQVLQSCVSELPSDGRCRDALADLESRHRF